LRQIFVSWVPTLHPFPEIALLSVRSERPTFAIEQSGQHKLIRGTERLADLESIVTLFDTGLFIAESEDLQVIPTDLAEQFGRAARSLYYEMGTLLHVHLFSHRLDFLPILASYTTYSPQTLVSTLHQRYFLEISEQQRLFDYWRSFFLTSARRVAESLLKWPILIPKVSKKNGVVTYGGELLHLLERRMELANVSEALYNCQGAGVFYRAFCGLHRNFGVQTASDNWYHEAYGTLGELYRDYGQLVGAYMLQAVAVFIAALAILLPVGFGAARLVPSGLPTALLWTFFVLLVALAYVGLWAFPIRRIAQRFLNVTSVMIESGTRAWAYAAES
jgi:hypothetical protein